MAPVCLPLLFFPGVRALNNLGVLPLLRAALQSVGWLLEVASWGPCLPLGFPLWPLPACRGALATAWSAGASLAFPG